MYNINSNISSHTHMPAQYNISQWLLFENVVQFVKVLIQTNFATLRKPVDRTVYDTYV